MPASGVVRGAEPLRFCAGATARLDRAPAHRSTTHGIEADRGAHRGASGKRLMRIFLLFISALAAFAQTRPSLMEDAGKENLPSQKLGVDDLVAVSVYDAPELTRTARVEADGAIHLPLLTNGVVAAGLYAHDVEASLSNALKNEQILVDPVVKVTVAEYHSRPISVMGAVRKPLTFQAIGAVTLLDALARAEGLNQDAGTEVLVSRPQP